METLMQLLGSLMSFVYHCFDRIVINGYLFMLSRPEQVVYFVKDVLAQQCITKEVLSVRTKDYTLWIDSSIPIEWAETGVRKEDYVRPYLKKLERENRFGVYFILKSMEQGNTFRSVEPKFPTDDPNWQIEKFFAWCTCPQRQISCLKWLFCQGNGRSKRVGAREHGKSK